MLSRLRRTQDAPAPEGYDAHRERRAERRARELMRAVVSGREYAMYMELGFVAVAGTQADGYAYLLYPHEPIVAYDAESGELLSEYCVIFPDRAAAAEGGSSRLPGADDVLAKWMSLRASERELIATANMHLPGRQLDPERVRRDLARLDSWSPPATEAPA